VLRVVTDLSFRLAALSVRARSRKPLGNRLFPVNKTGMRANDSIYSVENCPQTIAGCGQGVHCLGKPCVRVRPKMVHKTAPFQNARKVYNSSPMDRPSQGRDLLTGQPAPSDANIKHRPMDAREESNLKASPESMCSDLQLHATIGRLYPQLTKAERRTAAANLLRYSEIALIVAAKQCRGSTHLTHPEPVPTMKERSNVHLKE
jgi:hypothetical protein